MAVRADLLRTDVSLFVVLREKAQDIREIKIPFTNWDGSEDTRRSTHYAKETVARTYVFFGLGAPAPEAYRGQNSEMMPSVYFAVLGLACQSAYSHSRSRYFCAAEFCFYCYYLRCLPSTKADGSVDPSPSFTFSFEWSARQGRGLLCSR